MIIGNFTESQNAAFVGRIYGINLDIPLVFFQPAEAGEARLAVHAGAGQLRLGHQGVIGESSPNPTLSGIEEG